MKKIFAIFSMLILLFQAGGFVLHYFVLERHSTLNGDAELVYVSISMPYLNDWQNPSIAHIGNQNANASLQKDIKILKDVDIQISMDAEFYARDRFSKLADQMNKYLGEEKSSAPAGKKIILTLASEYCERAGPWVFYILEWPLKRLNHQHLVLPTINFQSDVYSPPRKA